MKTKAAVLVETGEPLEITDLTVPAPEDGQVIVELAYSGVCHTQLLEARGLRGNDPYLPHCLGHEGSGRVVETGSGVTRVEEGDDVVVSWMRGPGAEVPSSTYDWNGRTVNAGGVTTFQEISVISENRLTPLPPGIDLREAALLGCAVPTGAGAVLNTARARAGESVVVFGVGGIGLAATAAASAAGCTPVVAVDIVPEKLAHARRMGATHTVNANKENPVDALDRIVNQGVEIAIEASGRPSVMRQALASVVPRGGRAVVVGNAHHDERLTIDPAQLNHGKQLLGTWGGDNDPGSDFPRYAKLVREEHISVKPLLSEPYPLDKVNVALDDLELGRVVRPMLDLSLAGGGS